MIVSPQNIRKLCKTNNMIYPFVEKNISNGASYGLSECGYDVRLDQDVILYPISLWNLVLNACSVNRPSFTLASTMERFVVPDDKMFCVVDKSTWARRGLSVQNTVAEPGWSGYLTLELSLHGNTPLFIERGTAIAQIIFYSLDVKTERPYTGKYQNQEAGPQEARPSKSIDSFTSF